MKSRVAVIGAGPTGVAASIQLKRMGINPIVFEKHEVGGLLVNAHLVENYPGFPGGISGKELVSLFRKHFDEYDVNVRREEVRRLGWKEDGFVIETGQSRLMVRRVIVASGTKPRTETAFQISPGLAEKVFFDASPLLSKKNATVLIIGAGDAAFDYALNLARQNDVVILSRGNKPRALELLQERVAGHPRISHFPGTVVERIGFFPPDGIAAETRRCGKSKSFYASFALLALGCEPETGFFEPGLMDSIQRLMAEGFLHLAGDVKNGDCRQLGIAVGDGTLAAMEIAHGLQKNDR